MKVNCLLRDTAAFTQLTKVVQAIVAERLGNNQSAKVEEVYSEILKNGVEIDVESMGFAYDTLFSQYSMKELSDLSEIETFSTKEFKQQMGSLVNTFLGNVETRQEQIGNLSPESYAVNTISKMFQNAIALTSGKTQSAMKQMQDLATKAAKSFLPQTEAAKVKTLKDALDTFFRVEGFTFSRLDGGVNTLETLHNAIKAQVATYIDNVADTMSDSDLDSLKSQWEQYTDSFMDATYDIFLGKAAKNSLVNDALKNISLQGVNIIDFNGGIKWNSLIEYDNPDTIVEKVKELFKNGYTDVNGEKVKYTDSQSQRIGEYFRKLYLEKLENARLRAANNVRANNKSPQNIVSDFIKDRGFFNLVKNKEGKLLLTQTDWDSFLKNTQRELGKKFFENQNSMDVVFERLEAFLKSKHPSLTENQIALIKDKLLDTINAKMQPDTLPSTDLERFIALDKVNEGNAFNEETQNALTKLTGVPNLTKQVISQLQNLSQQAQNIINNSIGLTTTPSGSVVNRSAYAYTALAEIDRKIKEILRQHNMDISQSQALVGYMSDILGGATISLLLNPNNMIENVTTQLGSNISESFKLMFTEPKLFFKSFGNFQSAFWNQWINYASGGASNEIANEAELSNELQSSERLRVRGAMNEIKNNGVKGFMNVLGKSTAYLTNIASRVFMNSFDAASTASLLRKNILNNFITALKNQGKTSSEINKILGEVFNAPQNKIDEINSENNRIMSILEQSGINVTPAMKRQNKYDMMLSLYEDAMLGFVNSQSKPIPEKHVTEVAKTLISAGQEQAKALGGKRKLRSKDWISTAVYWGANATLQPQKQWFDRARKAQELGNMKKAAKLQMVASVYQNTISRFVGGVANFMVLGISATPLGALQAINLNTQRKDILESSGDAADVFSSKDMELVKRYSIVQGQMRSVVARSVMGSMAIAGLFIKSMFDEEDEDETIFDNLMKTKSGRRFIQKHFPVGVSMAAAYAYGDGDKDALENAFNMFETYTGKDFDSYKDIKRSFTKITSGNIAEPVVSGVRGYTPTYNINQVEQITRFIDVINSAFDVQEINTVEMNEELSKKIYKSAEGVAEIFLTNGAIDALIRAVDENQKFNRYKYE